MGLSRQNVQRIVNELEAQGVLRFAPNPHHQRAKLVLLTEHGRGLYKAAAERQGPWRRRGARRSTSFELMPAPRMIPC
jgi:DNA-binding MarR family transcriptional regulator